MNKARIILKHPVTLSCTILAPIEGGHEVSYEDCLGTMLPKFYYPAEPFGGKPARQVPQEAIERVEADEEVIARWERLITLKAAARAYEESIEDLPYHREEGIFTLRDRSDTTVYACTGCGDNVCPAEGVLGELCLSCEQDRRDGRPLENRERRAMQEEWIDVLPTPKLEDCVDFDAFALAKEKPHFLTEENQVGVNCNEEGVYTCGGCQHDVAYHDPKGRCVERECLCRRVEKRPTNGAGFTAAELHAAYARGGR